MSQKLKWGHVIQMLMTDNVGPCVAGLGLHWRSSMSVVENVSRDGPTVSAINVDQCVVSHEKVTLNDAVD